MTKPDYTALCLVIDSSGSMGVIKQATDDMINEFVSGQQKAEGKRTIRIATFDAGPNFLTDSGVSRPAAEVGKFSLVPGGMTALYDAVVTMITRFGAELAEMSEDERPAHVVFVIMTDGLENSSKEFGQADVKALITDQTTTYGWDFTYLGANQDAILEAQKMGIDGTATMDYAPTDIAMASVSRSLGGYVASAASGLRAAYSPTQRAAAMGQVESDQGADHDDGHTS